MLRCRAWFFVVLYPVLSSSCDRTPVIPPEQRVAAVQVTPSSAVLSAIGSRAQLTAIGVDASGRAVGGVKVSWSSSRSDVATVDSAGQVTAMGNGEAVISALVAGHSAAVTVSVRQVAGSLRLVWARDSTLHAFGPAGRITALVSDSNGNAVPGAVVTWSSSDTALADVDAAGNVRARRNGRVLLRGAVEAVSAELALVVDVRGFLRIRVATVGTGRVSGRYLVRIDNASVTVPSDTALTVADLVEGVHPLSMGPSPAAHCLLLSTDRLAPRVVPADTVEVAFTFRCTGRYSYANLQDHAFHYVDELGVDRAITPPFGRVSASDWSPDGAVLAFAAGPADDSTHIFTVRADGSGLTQLTNGFLGEDELHWSPDGSLILFHAMRGGGHEGWYTMRPDGSGVRLLADFDGWTMNAGWSPDGRWIQATGFENSFWGISRIDAVYGGKTPIPATEYGRYAALAPDGRHLAYTVATSAARVGGILDLATGAKTLLDLGDYVFGVTWSRSGKWLLIEMSGDTPWGTGAAYFNRVNADGTGLVRVSPNTDWFSFGSYSPDDRWILMLHSYSGIFVTDADGAHPQELPHAPGGVLCLIWRP